MARLLLIVEDASPIAEFIRRGSGLGDRPHLLLLPGIVVKPGERFRPGDLVQLKRPDGATLDGKIGGFLEVGCNSTRHGGWVSYENAMAIAELSPEAVPVGTEVWSVDRLSRKLG